MYDINCVILYEHGVKHWIHPILLKCCKKINHFPRTRTYVCYFGFLSITPNNVYKKSKPDLKFISLMSTLIVLKGSRPELDLLIPENLHSFNVVGLTKM